MSAATGHGIELAEDGLSLISLVHPERKGVSNL